jgi:hypothetical protein
MTKSGTKTILTDLVVLGRAAPEEMGDGRQTVCTGAWSPDEGFIRLYPIDPEANLFSRWDVIDAEVERNPKDARHESWKIKGRKQNQKEKVEIKGTYPREKRATLLHNLEDECVNVINDERRSLGIVKPEDIDELVFEEWDDDDAGHVQAKLLEELDGNKPDNRDEFEYNIKLRYTCPSCQTSQGFHNQTLLEWGAYMGLKNNPHNPSKLEENYRLRDDDYDHWLFVGNLNRHKQSFIVISIIWLKNDVPINSTLTPYPKKAPDFEPIDG